MPTVPDGAVLHLPVLRAEGGRARADLAFTHAVPATHRTGHTVAVGVDWGLNTLLSAGAVRLHPDGAITALGAGAQYRATGVLAKQHRLRRHAEQLHAKASQYERLIGGDARHPLSARAAALDEEHRRVSGRRTHLNDALAWSAARWTADQAIAAGATVIYVEDLRSLEARGMGRTLNTRLSQVVRGKITDRIRHLAAEHGIAVVTVPARGTSRCCPRCLAPLRHAKAPDRPHAPGWKWAICPNQGCSWQGDRDQGAWQRIAARGLTHQARTAVSRDAAMAVRNVRRRAGSRRGDHPRDSRAGPVEDRPDPEAETHAPRPGDAGHPPRHGPVAATASV